MLLFMLLALMVYATRLVGFFVTVDIHPFGLRFLHYLPVAIFAVFVIPGVTQSGHDGTIRLIAALVAAFVIWYSRRLWLGFIVGMGILWLLIFAG
jgi:branched-subunit amino acid transport protein